MATKAQNEIDQLAAKLQQLTQRRGELEAEIAERRAELEGLTVGGDADLADVERRYAALQTGIGARSAMVRGIAIQQEALAAQLATLQAEERRRQYARLSAEIEAAALALAAQLRAAAAAAGSIYTLSQERERYADIHGAGLSEFLGLQARLEGAAGMVDPAQRRAEAAAMQAAIDGVEKQNEERRAKAAQDARVGRLAAML